jgi:hydroxymethylpyrimidine pyrophosphatase-like HAD family hydrolase
VAIVAIDFDMTLVNGDKALPHAKEAINILRERGHKVLIFSCNNVKWIKKVLNDNDIRYDWIYGDSIWTGGKPVADLYIDDRGYHYRGDWKEELPAIIDRLEGSIGRIPRTS